MYVRALLPEGHPDRIDNLSGVNDPFKIPPNPHLVIETDKETVFESTQKLIEYIELNLSLIKK
jgi:adenylylsulfate kinase